MTKGLFINNSKAKDSIYESGLMVFNCLKLSPVYQLDYTEINPEQRSVPLGYDFYFINYHPTTMAWLQTRSLKKSLGLVITMVLEVLPGDPFVLCPDNHFHGYCVLDPTIRIRNKRVFAFPRPLETIQAAPAYTATGIPVIGTFGFATKGKGFQHVVEAVNKEFDKAIVRINIPYGDFVPQSKAYALYLADICRQKAKNGIAVEVTHLYMDKAELINWCAQNTLNCFLYDRNLPGLAATTDQAIVSGRPLAVSRNDTFRHILAYLPAYPECSLQESIARSGNAVKQMQHDWSPAVFAGKFEEMLLALQKEGVKGNSQAASGTLLLPLAKKNFGTMIAKRYRKYKRYFSAGKWKTILANRRKIRNEELI